MNEWDDDLGQRQVITWQTPRGSKINLTEDQANTLREADVWPKSRTGAEYCQVSHGLHRGYPTWSNEYVRWCAHHGHNPAGEVSYGEEVIG